MNGHDKWVECLDYGKQNPPFMMRIKDYPPRDDAQQPIWPPKLPKTKIPKFVPRMTPEQKLAVIKQQIAQVHRDIGDILSRIKELSRNE